MDQCKERPPVNIATITLNAAIDKRYVIGPLNPHTVMRVRTATYSAGGKGLNVARVANLLGENVTASGFLAGYAGEYVAKELTREGISEDFIWVAGETRSCINVLDESGGSTEFLEPGPVVNDTNVEQMAAKLSELGKSQQVVVMSGSLPRGVDKSLYAQYVTRLKACDCLTVVDTSGDALLKVLEAQPDVIKPNNDEIEQIVGRQPKDKYEGAALAHQISERYGIEVVILSLGKEGALAASASHGSAWFCAAPDVAVKNTVGCGDSFIAAFSCAYSRNRSVADALQYAVEVSSAAAMCDYTGAFEQQDLALVKQLGAQPEPIRLDQ